MADDRYEVNPLDGPAQLAEAIRELQRRVSALEGQPFDGSNLTIRDANGNVLVIIGKLPDGTYGLEIRNENARVIQKLTSTGQAFPRNPIPASPSLDAFLSGDLATSFRPGTGSATYVEIWRGDFSSVAETVGYDCVIFPNGGTMDWRILCYENGGTPTTALEETARTANEQRAGTFTIPTAGLIVGTGDDVRGREMTIRVEALKVSGAPATVDVVVGTFQNQP